tara:strand:- start:450 stop:716 length:267 start_codon:yes stop_codon:yes gene_type:complete
VVVAVVQIMVVAEVLEDIKLLQRLMSRTADYWSLSGQEEQVLVLLVAQTLQMGLFQSFILSLLLVVVKVVFIPREMVTLAGRVVVERL